MDSRKTIISIIAVMVLIIGVAGVSFAFYSYSRMGATDNVITSGKLLFEFTEDSNQIDLSNVVPVSDGTGTSAENATFTFHVRGYATGTATIGYKVYGVLGDSVNGKERLRDNEVKIRLTCSPTGGSCVSAGTFGGNTGGLVGAVDGTLKDYNDLLLATGTITQHSDLTYDDHEYSLKMWIPSSVVSIGDIFSRTSNTTVYTSGSYSKLYYSMKINVVVD